MRRKKGLTPIWHLEISAELKNHKVVLNKLKKDGRAIRRAFGSNSFMVPTFLIQDHYEFANYPLFSILQRYFDPVRKLSIDLERGQIYNINPEEVKKPEDIARPALIDHDGTGLAATIYSLQSVELASPYGPVYRELPGLHTRRRTVAQIMSVIKLVNSSISRIKVNSDALENQLKISAFVDSSMGEVEIPLSLLSDGTVKWLSLVTAIMTNESIFSIEEPENFLHPVMQKEIVAIIRSTGKSNQERFALMTTHSESLLNALDPSEVVVVSIAKARTQAIRTKMRRFLGMR
ncbi:MAG: AAA family ATPase [Bauldia sp.]